jgi:hypothetical protein
MRSHGVPMADPSHIPGHAGLSIDLPQQSQANAAAYAACDSYLRSTNEDKQAGQPPVSAAKLTALTNYARCMRAHDIALLDPDPQGTVKMGQVAGITRVVGRDSPQFLAADTGCRHLLPAGVYDDGTGP